MRETLTRKQKGFVKDYIKTGNGTQSALKNYEIESDKPEKVASAIATENLAKPIIQKAIAEALPDELLAKVHLEGLEATREIWKNNNKTGKIEFVADAPDYAVRHKYLDSAYKIKGSYAPEKSVSLNLNKNLTVDERIQVMAEEIANKLKEDKLNENS